MTRHLHVVQRAERQPLTFAEEQLAEERRGRTWLIVLSLGAIVALLILQQLGIL